MANKKQRRRNGKIDKLDPAIKDDVEQMILAGITYREIVEYLKNKGVELSRMAVCTYAKKFLATAQMLHIAQENFRMLTDEIDRHPDLDTTEGIIRVMSNSILNALANATPEDWESVKMESLMKEATSLVRAATYKKNQREPNEAAFQNMSQLVFDCMARKDPQLYKQVQSFLKRAKESNGRQG